MTLPEHISISQVDMFAKCPKMWSYRYVDGKIRPPGIAMLIGTGVHGGCEAAIVNKVKHGEGIHANAVRDAAVATYDAEYDEQGEVSTVGESKSVKTLVAEGRDRVAANAHFWGIVGQPAYEKPIAAEHGFEISLEQDVGRKVVGFIDCVEMGRVTDFKTTRKRYAQRDADLSIQLTCYAYWHRLTHGTYPTCQLDVIVDKATKTERQEIQTSRDAAHARALLYRLRDTVLAMENGIYPPCKADSWWCCPKFCGYTDLCPYYPS